MQLFDECAHRELGVALFLSSHDAVQFWWRAERGWKEEHIALPCPPEVCVDYISSGFQWDVGHAVPGLNISLPLGFFYFHLLCYNDANLTVSPSLLGVMCGKLQTPSFACFIRISIQGCSTHINDPLLPMLKIDTQSLKNNPFSQFSPQIA